MKNKLFLTLGISFFAIVISIGLAASGYFVGRAIERFKLLDRSVVVKGIAERVVKADLAVLRLTFTQTGSELENLSLKIQQNKEAIVSFLKKKGYETQEIQINSAKIIDRNTHIYSDNPKKTDRYILENTIIVSSPNVDAVSKIPEDLGELISQNIVISATSRYNYTKFIDLKPEMIAEATQNARKAADQFAKDSSSKVGDIKSANQGLFTITAKDFSGVENDYNESESIEKKVRVVSTITFSLDKA
jgi:hypothetical protein